MFLQFARVAAFAVAMLFASSSTAQVISNIVRGGSPNTGMMLPPVVVQGGMNPGALTFVDRVHVYAPDVPTFLRGLDYVRSANDDRTVADYTLDVTLSVPSTLYLFIDNRVGDGSNATPPTLGGTVMPWVAASGFTATTTQFGIDEGNDGTVNQFFTIYTRDVAAGTIRLFEQNQGTLNMYGLAAAPVAAVPEPASLVLAGAAGVALALRLRQRGSTFRRGRENREFFLGDRRKEE